MLSLVNLIIMFLHTVLFLYQEKKFMTSLRQYQVPLHKYMAMIDLQVHIHSIFSEFVTHIESGPETVEVLVCEAASCH